ncbi:hypothetical protein [Salinibacterium sp. ZJ450]|uniref:hypothetical protein n=1 Tax=Salinibacterium sp. ZJ450 TaxID=2708338 RepID=UPI001420E2B4|nr:hypothetical protein [Salinibacterium sp. ZJ450]
MYYVGVFVKAGVINLACMALDDGEAGLGRPAVGRFDRLIPSVSSENDAIRLLDLKNQVRQTLSDWDVHGVAVLDTMKHNQWKYADASTRLLSISAVMIAAAEQNADYGLIRPGPVGAHILRPQLKQVDPTVLGFASTPKYWTTGAMEAYAAASFWGRQLNPIS